MGRKKEMTREEITKKVLFELSIRKSTIRHINVIDEIINTSEITVLKLADKLNITRQAIYNILKKYKITLPKNKN